VQCSVQCVALNTSNVHVKSWTQQEEEEEERKKRLFLPKLDVNLRKKEIQCYILSTALCVVLKLGHCGKLIRNSWKVLKCGAGEEGEDQLDRSCER
jgi:hypothetical protein